MSNRELSPDAEIIMDALHGMIQLMEKKEKSHPGVRFYLRKQELKYFITKLEEKLGIIR